MSRPAGLSDDEEYDDDDYEAIGFSRRNRVNNIQERVRSPEDKLFDAVKNKDVTAVKAAIDEGADIHSRQEKSGSSAIMDAAFEGHKGVMEVLLQSGANVNDDHQMTNVVMCLCTSWSKDEEELLQCLKLLIEHGADPIASNWISETPLMLAVKHDHILLAAHLLEMGCDVNCANFEGSTAIMFAAKNENVPMAKLLVDAGANTKVMDRRGNGLVDIHQVSTNPELASLLGIEIDDDTIDVVQPISMSSYKRAMLAVPKKTNRMYGFHEDAVTFVQGIGLYDIASILEDKKIQFADLLTWGSEDWKRSGVNISYYPRKIGLAVKKYHEYPWSNCAIPKVENVIVDGELDLFVAVQFFLDFLRIMHISSATSLYILSNEPQNAESIEDIDKVLRYNKVATQQLQSIRKMVLSIESACNTVPPDLITMNDLPKQNTGFGLKIFSLVLRLSVSWRLPLFSDVDFSF